MPALGVTKVNRTNTKILDEVRLLKLQLERQAKEVLEVNQKIVENTKKTKASKPAWNLVPDKTDDYPLANFDMKKLDIL